MLRASIVIAALAVVGCGSRQASTEPSPEPERPQEAAPEQVSQPTRPVECEERVYEGELHIGGQTIQQLAGYTRITGSLWIEGAGVADLDGLQCLRQVDGTLVIRNTTVLRNLVGLEGLRHAHAIHFVDNSGLTSLRGLDGLLSCDVYIIIQRSASLTGLDGLGALRSPGDSLVFLGNSALPTCAAEALVRRLQQAQWTGGVRIEGSDDQGVCQ